MARQSAAGGGEHEAGGYGLFEEKYRAAAGRLPGGNPAKRARYAALRAEFGEKAVLEAVVSWAGQRGGPGKLAKNEFAAWDFLNGQGRSELLGSGGEVPGKSFEERMRRHREMDAETKKLVGGNCGG